MMNIVPKLSSTDYSPSRQVEMFRNNTKMYTAEKGIEYKAKVSKELHMVITVIPS